MERNGQIETQNNERAKTACEFFIQLLLILKSVDAEEVNNQLEQLGQVITLLQDKRLFWLVFSNQDRQHILNNNITLAETGIRRIIPSPIKKCTLDGLRNLADYQPLIAFQSADKMIEGIEEIFSQSGAMSSYAESFTSMIKEIQSPTAECNLQIILNWDKPEKHLQYNQLRLFRLYQYLIVTSQLANQNRGDLKLVELCRQFEFFELFNLGATPGARYNLGSTLGTVLVKFMGDDTLGFKFSTRLLMLGVFIKQERINPSQKSVTLKVSQSQIDEIVNNPLESHKATRATIEIPEEVVEKDGEGENYSFVSIRDTRLFNFEEIRRRLFVNGPENLDKIVDLIKSILPAKDIEQYKIMGLAVLWYSQYIKDIRNQNIGFEQAFDAIKDKFSDVDFEVLKNTFETIARQCSDSKMIVNQFIDHLIIGINTKFRELKKVKKRSAKTTTKHQNTSQPL